MLVSRFFLEKRWRSPLTIVKSRRNVRRQSRPAQATMKIRTSMTVTAPLIALCVRASSSALAPKFTVVSSSFRPLRTRSSKCLVKDRNVLTLHCNCILPHST
ncbi:hypothetical protein JG687_00014465 [Phytophthora cactorum]|uniref:Uncharacterized protein n=1 Tax=Phytophthora cactorum TaxID=29920 RepID=A0A8T1TYP4_9STRA|nr:hypothetical protein JG687_00014465 [Phytophthora cactorum]